MSQNQQVLGEKHTWAGIGGGFSNRVDDSLYYFHAKACLNIR